MSYNVDTDDYLHGGGALGVAWEEVFGLNQCMHVYLSLL